MRGLTLVQIIVVLVILAFLAAVVLPTLAFARESARRTQCCKQIRSLMSAMYMYSDSPSNNGFLPTDSSTTDPYAASNGAASLGLLYRQYVNDPRIFFCPSDPVIRWNRSLGQAPGWNGSSENGWRMKPEQISYAYDPGHHANTTAASVVIMGDKAGSSGNSDNHGRGKGQCVVFGTTSEFRDSVRSPLDEKGTRFDPDIFARNAELPRDDDSFIRD